MCVSVGVSLPSLSLQDPARLATATGVAATGHRVAELAVRVLRVLLQVADLLQALLVAELDPGQGEYGVLHGHRYLLAHSGRVALDDRGEQADQQVHTAVAVAEGRAADGRRAVPEAR